MRKQFGAFFVHKDHIHRLPLWYYYISQYVLRQLSYMAPYICCTSDRHESGLFVVELMRRFVDGNSRSL